MPQIPRYTSQVAPVSTAGGAFANTRAMSDTGEAQMWSSIGQSTGQALGRIGEVMFSIEKDRRDLQDKSTIMDMDTAFTVAKTRMAEYVEANPDKPDTYVDVQRELTNQAMSGIQFDKLSKGAYEIASKQAEAFSIEGMATAQLTATKYELKNTTTKAVKGLEMAVASGDPEKVEFYSDLVQGLPIQQEEKDLFIAESMAKGEATRHANLMSASKDQIVSMVEAGQSEDAVNEFIKTVKDPSDRESLRDYHKSTLTNTKAKNKLAYETAEGAYSQDFSGKYREKTLTEDYIWSIEPTDVPIEHRKDFDSFRESWASRVRTQTDRIANQTQREKNALLLQNYDAKLVSSLEDEAERATTPGAIDAVNLKIADAESESQITEQEAKTLYTLADGAMRTETDMVVSEQKKLVENSLVGRFTEERLMLERKAIRGKLTKDDERKMRDIGFNIQVAKHQYMMYSNEVNARLRDPDQEKMSPEDARVYAARVWQKYRSKSTEQQVREFRTFETPTGYAEGDVIERGGMKYKVVGFDTDGEPLVNEVSNGD